MTAQTPAVLSIALALLLAGCGSMAMDGVVVDHAGQPVPDATITAVGTQYQTKSDATGAFSLEATPGVYDLIISQVGYVTVNFPEPFEATERKRYDLGRQVLVKVPDQEGLLLFLDASFSALEPGFVERKSGGFGSSQYRHYCLDREGSAVNVLTPGVHTFYDHASVGWRAFELDEQGCAYKMSPNGPTSWGIDYNEKAEVETEQLEKDLSRAQVTFEVGEYFIAHWDQGFFTKSSKEDPRYTGFYVKVQ
jgi:hypothetical protein